MAISLEYLLVAKGYYQKYGSEDDQADILNALASYYSDSDQMEKAFEKYHEALDIYTKLDDTLGQANIHANLGLAYTDTGEFEKAEFHLLKQGYLDTLLQTNWGLGFHYDFMGNLRQEEGKLDEALNWHMKGLNIRKKMDSHYNLCESYLSIGGILIVLDNCPQAIEYLEKIFDFKEQHQSLVQEQRAHKYLSECYEKTKDHDNALVHFKAYKTVSDSIYKRDKLEEIAEMESQLKKQELDNEIALLSKENEIKFFELKHQRLIAVSSLLSLFLLSLFSFFIYKLYLKIKIRNQKISKSLSEKDILLREIHHRVKNNLQVISSLLSLQSRQIEDTHIKQAIDEGRSRVRSMALIHQNLYQHDSLTTIDVNNYLQRLIEELFSTYNISSEKVKLLLNIESIQLDVDTMVPLGLIINELVSNALKHAFRHEEEIGIIKVTLKEEEGQLYLNVQDNGIGVDVEKMLNSKSFGNRLIKAFGQKLKADIAVKNENGTLVEMKIKNYKKAA